MSPINHPINYFQIDIIKEIFFLTSTLRKCKINENLYTKSIFFYCVKRGEETAKNVEMPIFKMVAQNMCKETRFALVLK